MTDPELDPVAALADEFMKRRRAGEHPKMSEYIDRHPELAEEIREIFPMMQLMEDHGPETDEVSDRDGYANLERLGDYQILREIGRGGMGVVYEALQESLGRHVALKVLSGHSRLDARNRQRFKRESRSAAILHHTNIVPVYGVGETDGLLYYAMQFIRGAGLDEVLQELKQLRQSSEAGKSTMRLNARSDSVVAGAVAHSIVSGVVPSGWSESQTSTAEQSSAKTTPARAGQGQVSEANPASDPDSPSSGVHLPGQTADSTLSGSNDQYWRSVARIGVQVAGALEYAHGQGTLHRDIKPSNLLLDTHGRVWVTDFGLAKSLEEDDLTHTGELVGTLRYMPPEQFSGRADERSDVYSLGLSLYELATLRPAFDNLDRNQLIRSITDSDPPRPSKLDPRLPRDLETIILKAISREPAGRYRRAADLASDLNRFINREPIQARPVSAHERLLKWARRKPAVAALSATLSVVVLVALSLVTWKWREAEMARSEMAAERNAALVSEKAARRAGIKEAQQRQTAEQLLVESKRNLYYSQITQADLHYRIGNLDRVELSLEQAGSSTPESNQPLPWEWRYLESLLHSDLLTLAAGTESTPWVRALAFSRDGRLLATGSAAPTFLNTRSGSPGKVRIWEVATGRLIREIGVNRPLTTREIRNRQGQQLLSVLDLAFDADAKCIAVRDVDVEATTLRLGQLRIFDVATGKKLVELDGGGRCADPAFTPDGRFVAAQDPARRKTYLWDRDTGKVRNAVASLGDFRISQDGNRLITVSGDLAKPTLSEWDIETGEQLRVIQDLVPGAASRHFMFAARNTGSHTNIWDQETGNLLYQLRGHRGTVSKLIFRFDDREIATASTTGSVRTWDVTTGNLRRVFRGHRDRISSLAYSPDGNLLASGGWRGQVKVWNAKGNQAYRSFLPPSGYARNEAVALIPRKHQLAVVRQSSRAAALYLYDLRSGEQIDTWGLDLADNLLVPSQRAAFSRTGDWLVGVPDETTQLNVWNLSSGKPRSTLTGHQAPIHYVAIDDNGKRVASSSGNYRRARPLEIGEIRVWDRATATELRARRTAGSGTTAMTFNPDGSLLALAGIRIDGNGGTSGVLELWNVDADTVTLLEAAVGSRIDALAFDASGKLLATAENSVVTLWDTETRRRLWRITASRSIHDLCFSPDQRRLAGATRQNVTLVDVATGHEVLTLPGPPVGSQPAFNPRLCFGPSDDYLAACQWDSTVRVWACSSPRTVNEYTRAPPDPVPDTRAGMTYGKVNRWTEVEREYQRIRHNLGGDETCLTLTGSGDHIAAPPTPFDQFDEFTVEVWVKNWQGSIFSLGNYRSGGFSCYDHRTVLWLTDPKDPGHRIQSVSLDSAERHAWSHLAVCFDGESVRVFRDGTLQGSLMATDGIHPLSHANQFLIGSDGTTRGFGHGLMRALRVSKTARYQDHFEPPPQLEQDDDTVLLFSFSTKRLPHETQVSDRSGNENHGKITDAWWVWPPGAEPPATGWQAAVERISQRLQSNPIDGWLLARRGFAYSKLKQIDLAKTDYDRARKILAEGDSALLFTGKSEHIVAPHLSFDKLAAFTLEFWVKDWQGTLLYQGNAWETGIQTNERFTGFAGKGDVDFQMHEFARCFFGKIPAQQWNHLVTTFDGKVATSFLNGHRVGSVQAPPPAPLNKQRPLRLGWFPYYEPSTGLLRSVRISSGVKYKESFQPPSQLDTEADTLLLYDFSTAPGQPMDKHVPDLSGRENHGTLTQAWWVADD